MMEEKGQEIYTELLRDFGSWFGQAICLAFYNTDVTQRANYTTFSVVAALSPVYKELSRDIPQQVIDSEYYLSLKTKSLLAGNLPPVEDVFQTFLQAYEGLSGLINRLEKDALLVDNGIDPQTGLRSERVMIADLERELERRARRGQPFSIALTRIDGETDSKDPQKVALAIKILQKTLRSFDDAYVTGQGDYLVSLKHSDVNGALKFAKRLSDALGRDDTVTFSMSCCVAEPVPGENIFELIDNTRNDLNHIAGLGSGASGQYEDLSPLSRFIQKIKDDEKAGQ